MSGKWFPVFQRNAVPFKGRAVLEEHRESVVKCGYSGNRWWVAGMVVNAEKNPEHFNRLNLLCHLRKSTDWVHVQEFLRV